MRTAATDFRARPTFGEILMRHQETAPVDVEALARDFGLAVRVSDRLGPGVSGKLERNPRVDAPSGYAIYVNAAEPPRRRRFTIAHEIAHYVLHGDLIEDRIVDDTLYRSGLSDHYERQANGLAADILMPLILIKRLYREGRRDVASLAEALDVSPTAMEIRLSSLGILRHFQQSAAET